MTDEQEQKFDAIAADLKPVIVEAVMAVGRIIFVALVAWGAVSGNGFWRGVAIFVALRYLQEMKHGLDRLGLAVEAKPAPITKGWWNA